MKLPRQASFNGDFSLQRIRPPSHVYHPQKKTNNKGAGNPDKAALIATIFQPQLERGHDLRNLPSLPLWVRLALNFPSAWISHHLIRLQFSWALFLILQIIYFQTLDKFDLYSHHLTHTAKIGVNSQQSNRKHWTGDAKEQHHRGHSPCKFVPQQLVCVEFQANRHD